MGRRSIYRSLGCLATAWTGSFISSCQPHEQSVPTPLGASALHAISLADVSQILHGQDTPIQPLPASSAQVKFPGELDMLAEIMHQAANFARTIQTCLQMETYQPIFAEIQRFLACPAYQGIPWHAIVAWWVVTAGSESQAEQMQLHSDKPGQHVLWQDPNEQVQPLVKLAQHCAEHVAPVYGDVLWAASAMAALLHAQWWVPVPGILQSAMYQPAPEVGPELPAKAEDDAEEQPDESPSDEDGFPQALPELQLPQCQAIQGEPTDEPIVAALRELMPGLHDDCPDITPEAEEEQDAGVLAKLCLRAGASMPPLTPSQQLQIHYLKLLIGTIGQCLVHAAAAADRQAAFLQLSQQVNDTRDSIAPDRAAELQLQTLNAYDGMKSAVQALQGCVHDLQGLILRLEPDPEALGEDGQEQARG